LYPYFPAKKVIACWLEHGKFWVVPTVKNRKNVASETANMTKQEINKYLCAILPTLNEVDYAPESMIYLAIGADAGKWEVLKVLLCSSGLATSENYAMRITAKGRELAAKINAFVAA
jgi:hypothetical protein